MIAKSLRAFAMGLIVLLGAAPAQAAVICTLLAEPQTGEIVLEEGDCTTRVTPASTFKLALAVMGFDDGILKSPTAPVYSFEPGDPDWGVDWEKDTNPTQWMKNSVLWYSQRLTRQMGANTLTDYAKAFGYGNADFSGDPGFDNGLERAWVSSSLKVSPREQAAFVSALVEGSLPVSAAAMAGAKAVTEEAGTVDGWRIWGKTGSAYPRNADRSFNYARGWGWYVGWGEKDGRRLVFVRLTQDEARQKTSCGLRAREAVLAEWPQWLQRATP